jgi:bifunctional DNase/RNase
LRDVLTTLGASLSHVVITELRDATYYAELRLSTPNGEVSISARPSDAIALALRTDSPLYVDDELMEEHGRLIELSDEDDEEEGDDDEAPEGDVDELAEQFRDFLDNVRPEDFQK